MFEAGKISPMVLEVNWGDLGVRGTRQDSRRAVGHVLPLDLDAGYRDLFPL